jgi:drug/metabolite transporter (DMT)-like permease
LLLCCLFNGSSNVVMKRQIHDVHALATNTTFFFAASISLWIAAALTGQLYLPNPLPLGPTAALLYLTFFGTLLTFAAWFYMMKRVRLSTSMTLACVTPIIALIVDAFFEKHAALTLESYVGAAVVILGVTTTIFFKLRSDK